MAPIGAKLWENAFQTIPDVSFFDAEKKFFDKKIRKNPTSNQERAVLEEQWIFESHQHVGLEKLPPMNPISALYDFWWRGKKPDFRFFVDFWPKTDLQFSFANDNMMIWWYDDMMIWWYDNRRMWWLMMWRYDDTMIWCYDHMTIGWYDEVMIAYDPTHH